MRVPENKLTAKPANLTLEQAAVVPISGLTALQALRDHGHVQPGQKVLIIGASGGVGTYAVQLAKAFGADVTGVCSTTKADLVRAIGADEVIDYTREDFADGEDRYDLILDIGGNSSLSRLRRALTREGRLTIVGGESDGRWLGGFDRTVRAPLLSAFVSQDLGKPWVCSENHEDLAVLTNSSRPGRSPRPSTGHSRFVRPRKPSSTWSTDTPTGRLSSPSAARTLTPEPRARVLQRRR